MHLMTQHAAATPDGAVSSDSLWSLAWRALGPPTLLAALVWWAADIGYLFSHTLAELLSMVVAGTALVVASTSVHFTRNHFVVLVSVAIGWCAGLDLLHTLTFQGMRLLPTDSANPATQFWVAARFMQAVALVLAPFMLTRSIRMVWLHLGFGSWSVLCTALIAAQRFPQAYVDGQGLTPFKIYTEYLIIALLGLALWSFWRHRALMSKRLLLSMSVAVLAMMASELAFTVYVGVYAGANMAGHLLKIYAYWFVYVALVHDTLREPFSLLSRAASTYDAVPDPTLIVRSDGLIQQANRAAASYLGCPAEQLVGQSSHALLHDAALRQTDCPVCTRLRQPGPGFLLELELSNRRAIEVHMAPFATVGGGGQAWVQVVRDISERRRLAREREALLHDLGERVKELRCMYAVSELTDRPDIQMSALLQGLVEVLPAGFVLPQHLCAAVEGHWGHFGVDLPGTLPQCHLVAAIEHAGHEVGHIQVWYPDALDDPQACFLPEEQVLIQNIARHVNEAIQRQQSAERIQRLSYLYEMLSATNRAAARCHDQAELLGALRDALLAHGTFPMLFIALVDEADGVLRLTHHHGIPEQRLGQLQASLSDPDSPLVPAFAAVQRGEVIYLAVPPAVSQDPAMPMDDFHHWVHFLSEQGIEQRAFMPLMCQGQLFGVVGLYPGGLASMDAEQMRLLEDMSSDIGVALDRFEMERRRQQAEDTAQRMEHRFREVFRASPLPMQIVSVPEGRLLAVNEAYTRWLGYELSDLPTVTHWFEQAYPDADVRADLARHWQHSLEEARREGRAVQSPELTLRCKDGSTRIARGTVTVVNDDAIVAWIDLTDMHRSAQALRDSEQRFRGMVEQTISGMYVRRDGRFIYVNPRFCEIIGWSAEELVGRDVLEFTTLDPENIDRIKQAWRELHTSESQSVAYSVPMVRKDGQIIEAGLKAKVILWDDGLPATIVMAQDITERKRAEDQIAAYVKQLEGSMRGTLQAVSNMVEMRDPYTAGHERRVGLLARDIAREMGWDESRCQNLELMGLVHDIGKIAVPSEILTKPTRLSDLEMALMRGHAQAGYEILKDVPFPAPVAEIIRQHHERMDGSGYPQGLKGDQILPEARVLAVADVLESMSSHRPYRPAVGMDAALSEVVNNQGRLYDPDVVAAAVKLVKERGYVLPA
ncbi:MAG TPA: MASE3 domain-containing protein [Aquabacterium sp.]|uniref:MASE3 domain-containing protein n=1 Tax=Aquabacterium sp. TaxID=1872578 RepID=UPI002E339539|nr:MASE3 domain-containing protein [Aquabacterium sp.]HEX5371976.1 MASE3 domain-containing protein [Aquabacterium sp.]